MTDALSVFFSSYQPGVLLYSQIQLRVSCNCKLESDQKNIRDLQILYILESITCFLFSSILLRLSCSSISAARVSALSLLFLITLRICLRPFLGVSFSSPLESSEPYKKNNNNMYNQTKENVQGGIKINQTLSKLSKMQGNWIPRFKMLATQQTSMQPFI